MKESEWSRTEGLLRDRRESRGSPLGARAVSFGEGKKRVPGVQGRSRSCSRGKGESARETVQVSKAPPCRISKGAAGQKARDSGVALVT